MSCVMLYANATHPRGCTIDDVTCLQNRCTSQLMDIYKKVIEPKLKKPLVFEPFTGPICVTCKLPRAAHKFNIFGRACDEAEANILNDCIKQNDNGHLIQRCPKCGIWVVKAEGCNSVQCRYTLTQLFMESYCKFLWCWLCRSQVDAKHYLPFNPFGCPGLVIIIYNHRTLGSRVQYQIRVAMA